VHVRELTALLVVDLKISDHTNVHFITAQLNHSMENQQVLNY